MASESEIAVDQETLSIASTSGDNTVEDHAPDTLAVIEPQKLNDAQENKLLLLNETSVQGIENGTTELTSDLKAEGDYTSEEQTSAETENRISSGENQGKEGTDLDHIASQESHTNFTELSQHEQQEPDKDGQGSETLVGADKNVSLESVSADESEVVQTVSEIKPSIDTSYENDGRQNTAYTDIQSPETIPSSTKQCEDQTEQKTNEKVYTETQSPDQGLPSVTGRTDYTDIKSPDQGLPSVTGRTDYTDIKSPDQGLPSVTGRTDYTDIKSPDQGLPSVTGRTDYTDIKSPDQGLPSVTGRTDYTDIKSPDQGLPSVTGRTDYTDIKSPDQGLPSVTGRTDYTDIKSPDQGLPSVTGRTDYTDIKSPDQGLPSVTGRTDYTDIKSPDQGLPSVTGRTDYTDIQSPEAKSSSNGPSDDREDISDAELDLPTEKPELSLDSAPHLGDGNKSSYSVVEAHDLKVDDAGSVADDASRVSKGASEDLEAVSDDELPEGSHTRPTFPKAVVEGGEDVSSDDEDAQNVTNNVSIGQFSKENVDETVCVPPIEHEPVSPTALPDPESPVGPADLTEPVSPIALGEPVSPAALPEPISPTALAEPISPTALEEPISPTALLEAVSPAALAEPVSPTALAEPVSPTALAEPVSPAALSELTPLDAEPISEDEDNSGLVEDEDGEAGEIKSPTEDITSPPSSPEQGGANLGEVEPVSAEDTNDTDGELPSGDEDDQTKPKTEKFESIESEDDGDLDNSLKPSGYMESISDEENVETSSGKIVASSELLADTRTAKNGVSGKRMSAPNFNEHQVELDYEETEGDDADLKPEETSLEQKIEEEEEGKLQDSVDSDKDEGELSDDDCEEGEIKEPGTRKPFMKPMCRFFQRGNCTWGVNCRFLHPGVNDKGNYQMIEIPGFQPTGVHARLGGPGPWQEPAAPVEQVELPPPPLPNTPPPETAWERGLRIAKEQRKKANERKEQEPDFEEKRLNLSVDEERELNKENERVPRIIPKDPYYDQQAFEENEYYKLSRDPWQTGHYENFEVRYNREPSYSPPPPYREKGAPPPGPPMRYSRPYHSPPLPPVDKFGRDRMERKEEYRPKPAVPPPPAPVANEYPSPPRRPDEWVDPWRRQTTRKNSKSPTRGKQKRSHSRGRRGRQSVSDSSNSSRSGSGSSTGSSRSSRSYSGSSGSSSRSRSPEPAPPGVERRERYQSPSRDQPRSAVSVRGRGGGHNNNYDSGYRRDQHNYGRIRGGGGGGGGYQTRGGWGRGRGGGHYGGPGGRGGGEGYHGRENRDRGRPRAHSPPDRPLPYVRPRPRSASSHSSSSGSHSRSRSRSRPGREVGRGRGSSSRSSSGSSSSRSSSSSSAGSADSEHLYRDLGSPRQAGAAGNSKKKRVGPNSHKDRTSSGGPPAQPVPGSQRHSGMPPPPVSASQQPRHHVNLENIPIPRDAPRDGRNQREGRETRDLRPPGSSSGPPVGRSESRYASRNAPQAPPKAKDPLKLVGQKSNIKLTLLPKQQQSSLGNRPNPLDSPPRKRRMSDREVSPQATPPAKRLNLPLPQASAQRQASALRLAIEKAAKLQVRQEKVRPDPPPPSSSQHHVSGVTQSLLSSRARAPVSPQKQASSGLKSRGLEPAVAKTAPKLPSSAAGGASGASMGASAPGSAGKAKKSMSSRREELLKQLKAVEDAIARKKTKLT